MLNSLQLAAQLSSHGFGSIHKTTKVTGYQKDGVLVYLKNREQTRPLVIHGKYALKLSALLQIPGVERTRNSAEPYHNADMKHFDLRLNNGRKPTRYGYDFDLADSTSLSKLLAEL